MQKATRRRHLYMVEDLFVTRLLQVHACMHACASIWSRIASSLGFVTRLPQDTIGRGAVRTTDPEQADLFFVPSLQWHTQGPRCPRAAVRLMAHYIRSAYPYWERTGGRDRESPQNRQPAPCALHPVPDILYPVPCALYPVPCTLCPAPCDAALSTVCPLDRHPRLL